MGSILEKIEQALKDMLIGWIESNLTNMFTDVNEKVGTIAAEVGQTPSGWNGGVYQMIRGLSENVIVPIAGIIITFVLCYELISKQVVKRLLERERRKERKLEAGILPRPKGRPRKDTAPRDIVAEQAYEIWRLRMENKLLRDFLRCTGRT